MKKLVLAAACMIFSAWAVQSQSNAQVPYSFYSGTATQQVSTEILQKPNVSFLLTEDIAREKQGIFYRTGIFIHPKFEITENTGVWSSNADGSVSWFMRFEAAEAKALGIYFDYFSIPGDGELFVYNDSKTHVVGPYTLENSTSGDLFATAPVMGEAVTIEYHGSTATMEAFKIKINEVAYMYRDASFGPKDAGEFGDSEACEVNANCSEGASWDAQRRSVVKIIVRDGSSAGLCSGAMVNSTNNDCTPYVLTANHCGGGASTANFKQWVFYFNFETPGCTNPASATNLDDQTVTGCLKMANSSDVSDVVASDFLLVHLKNRPATSFNAFMAGWSRSVTAPTLGVGIHHPAGDVKKISTYAASTNAGWSGSNFGKHWGVVWIATANGHGVTEGGSSGSPLFDNVGRIVGDLSGGSSFCTNTSGQDVYGKFVYSWDQTASTSNRRLKDWLDKTNVNSTTLNGKEVNSCPSDALPTVDFVANNLTPSVGEVVTLTNQTTGNPAGYQWQITPATFTYVNGTNEFSQNPQVTFSSVSFYSVTLNAYNTAGYALKLRGSYIKPHNTASINESASEKTSLYPNPTTGLFQITTVENPMEKVEITDMNGKTVYRWTGEKMNLQVDVREFSRGVYTVKIQSGKTISFEKLILN